MRICIWCIENKERLQNTIHFPHAKFAESIPGLNHTWKIYNLCGTDVLIKLYFRQVRIPVMLTNFNYTYCIFCVCTNTTAFCRNIWIFFNFVLIYIACTNNSLNYDMHITFIQKSYKGTISINKIFKSMKF